MTGAEQLRVAIEIATLAHYDQRDKVGAPYILHPLRVMARVLEACDTQGEWHPEIWLASPDELAAIAVLHDVLEDTDVTTAKLAEAGINRLVIDAVETLTHLDGEPRKTYMARVKRNPFATFVKEFGDIADNTDPSRLGRLRPAERARLEKKYENDLAILHADDKQG